MRRYVVTGQMLLILLSAVLGGAALVALGLRGKRLNDHPTCRDCGFDLSGAAPGTVTCPECGAGLKRAKGIRVGQRRRRPVFIAVGALLVGLPLLMIATAGWALLTGAEIDQYKPLGLLTWEARHTSAARMTSIAKELNRRVSKRLLSAAQRDSAVKTALAIQEDVSKPWCPEWGDLVEDARVDGVLAKDDDERFRRNAAVLEWKVRPKVRAGDAVPIVATVKEARVGSSSSYMAIAHMTASTIDGKASGPVRRKEEIGITFVESPQQTSFQLFGPKSPWGMGGMGGWVYRIPNEVQLAEAAPAGRHECEVTLRVKTIQQPTGSYTWPDLRSQKAGDIKEFTSNLAFESIPADADPIETVPPTEEMTGKLQALMRPQPIMLWEPPPGESGFGHTYYSNIQFSIDGLPVGVAYTVSVKTGNKTIKVGRFTSGISAENAQAAYGPGMDKMRFAQGDLSGVGKAKTVTVILTPSVDAAKRTIDLTKIYGGELVFEDVVVNRQQQGISYSMPAQGDDSEEPSKETKVKKPGLLDFLIGK
jgi:hypothetical protein